MSLINGIGDEVVEFFIGLSVVLIGATAWWSTRIVERPIIRTVLVFERRSQSSSSSAERVVPSIQSAPETTEDTAEPPVASTSSAAANDSETSADEEQDALLQTMDSDANILRQRRLRFFRVQDNATASSDDGEMVLEETTRVQSVTEEHAEPEAERTPVPDQNDIRIKLKYINDDLKLVSGKLQEQVGDFKKRHFEPELASNKLVRLIFNGQVLQRDEQTLQGCGLFDNCVVHCLVHQKRTGASEQAAGASDRVSAGSGDSPRTRTSGGAGQTRDWDLGNLFFALVSFVLGAAWYFRYEYAQLYTVSATVALVGLTGIFTVLLVGMYFPDTDAVVQNVRAVSATH